MFPNVKTGDIVKAEHIHQLIDEIKKAQIKRVIGGTFFANSGGTSISIQTPSAGGGGGGKSKYVHPFKVVPGYTSNGGSTLRVAGQSYLTNIEKGTRIPILNMGAVIGGPNDDENDQGQFSFPQAGHLIWLTIECYNLEIVGAYIEHGLPGEEGEWENFPSPVELTEDPVPECRYSRIGIASIHDETDDVDGESYNVTSGQGVQTLIVRQLVTTHLGVKLGVSNYVICPLIFPYSAPGDLTTTTYGGQD